VWYAIDSTPIIRQYTGGTDELGTFLGHIRKK
jgi:hypothetical protein